MKKTITIIFIILTMIFSSNTYIYAKNEGWVNKNNQWFLIYILVSPIKLKNRLVNYV